MEQAVLRYLPVQSNYADRARVETQSREGDSPVTRVILTPVTQKVTAIFLRSLGPDGVAGTSDDFTVANFTGTLAEEVRRNHSRPQATASRVVLFRNQRRNSRHSG